MQNGETAIQKAAKYAHTQVIEMLLDAHANIDELNKVCYNCILSLNCSCLNISCKGDVYKQLLKHLLI